MQIDSRARSPARVDRCRSRDWSRLLLTQSNVIYHQQQETQSCRKPGYPISASLREGANQISLLPQFPASATVPSICHSSQRLKHSPSPTYTSTSSELAMQTKELGATVWIKVAALRLLSLLSLTRSGGLLQGCAGGWTQLIYSMRNQLQDVQN